MNQKSSSNRQDVLRDIDVSRLRADLEHICNEIPSRLAGSENARRMTQYALRQMRAAGLEAEELAFPGLVSFPDETALVVEGDEPRRMKAATMGHSVETSGPGVSGVLCYAGAGGYGDYQGVDPRGKIVLLELSYHPGRHEKQRIAAELGAIGCVMMNWGADDNTLLPFGSVKPAWGNPTPATLRDEMATLPCIGVSRADGLALKALCDQRPTTVSYATRVENGWRELHIARGRIEPALRTPSQDDYVVAGGHCDSWFGPQATDNAAGSAFLLELARLFGAHRDKLRRGIEFGFWTAHETGTMVGSTWYVDQYWDQLRDHCVAYFQVDQPACLGTSRWGSVSNAELKVFQQGVDAELMPDTERSWRRTVKIGDASFFGVGVPMLAAQAVYGPDDLKKTANANFGWWHHSVENSLDKVDWESLPRHMRAYASYLYELCTAVILPMRFRFVAYEIHERLGALADAGAGIGLDTLRAEAARLVSLAEDFDARLDALSAATVDAATEAAVNTAIKRLSRCLLPVVGTICGKYGHDSYSITAQSTVLPGLYSVTRLNELEGEARWVLETRLRRERNRISDALAEAAGLMEGLA